MNSSDVILHPGNEELQRFINISLLAATLGISLNFHVEGPRGTGKTTMIRAVKEQLPKIRRIKDCVYNCDPEAPYCPIHKNQGEFASELVPMPFAEISQSAKTGTVVGSLDLEKLTAHVDPEAALLPGTLPQANRGIVFVDEINRIADTSPVLVDILLDVMGTKPGRIQIEETGLQTTSLPVNLTVWAASNPDEEPGPLADIRRQLSDRFDFSLNVKGPYDVQAVRAILQRKAEQKMFTLNMRSDTACFKQIHTDPAIDEFLSDLYVRYRLESIRGIQAARMGAEMHAFMLGKCSVSFSDLAAVLPAAMRYRMDDDQLSEINDTLKKISAKKHITAKSSVFVIKTKQSMLQRGLPGLWRGLWQRISRKEEDPGKAAVLFSAANPVRQLEQDEEKKKIKDLKKQHTTGGQVK